MVNQGQCRPNIVPYGVILCLLMMSTLVISPVHASHHNYRDYLNKFKSFAKNAWCKITGHLPNFVKKIFPEFCHLQTGLTVPGGINDLKSRIMRYEDTIFNQRCRLLVMDLKESGLVPWDKATDKVVDIVKTWYKTFIIRFIDLQKDMERSDKQIFRDLTKFIEEERIFEDLVFTLKDNQVIKHKTDVLDCVDVIEDWYDHYHRDNKYTQ